MRPKPCVAVLGTGIMGSAIAQRLVGSGFVVRAWNRTQAKARAIRGATVATHPTAAVDGADIVITMLTDGEAVEQVMGGRGGAIKEMKGSAVWLQMSTVGVDATERLVELAEWGGVRIVDAPVLGSRAAAEQGELVVLAGGPDDAIEHCRPVLETIGKRTIPLGSAGQASALKLVFNSWLACLTTALGEALALCEAFDLDPDEFLGAITGSPVDMPYAHVKGPMMIKRDYPPSFPLRHGLKDVLLVQDAAVDLEVETRMIDAAAIRIGEAVEAGHGDADLAAVFEAVRKG